jgi:hypothetical protein
VDSTAARSPDRSIAGPQRGAELGGDDHRDRGLAEPGRPGQQHVVRRAAAAQRAAQQERQLLADAGLADEVIEALGPQRALDRPLVAVGERRHDALAPRVGRGGPAIERPGRRRLPRPRGRPAGELGFLGPGQRVAFTAHDLDSFRRAARSAVVTSGA